MHNILGNKSILWNKYSSLGFLLLLMQLTLSASSNFILANFGVSITKGITSALYYIISLSLYVGLLILAELPASFSKLNFDRAVYEVQKAYITQFNQTHKNQVILNAETTFKDTQEAWLMVRSGSIIQASLSIFYNLTSLGLGVILNISAISIAGDIRLIIGYIISFIIMYFATKYFKKELTILIEKSHYNKTLLAVTLQSGWDNIVIGNEYNQNNWWKTCMERLENARQASFRELYKQNFSELVIRFLITLPIFIGTSILIMVNINNPIHLAPLLVTLPIQMRLIPEICAVATYINFWNKMSLEIDLLLKSLSAPREKITELDNRPTNRIKWNLIYFTFDNKNLTFNSVAQITDYLSTIRHGRLCIRGPNQSGKTTISNLLKQQLPDAIYIPTNSKLYFKSTFEIPVSTGQKTLNQLKELFLLVSQYNQPKIIILDEWDANLDSTTLLKLSNFINQLSKKHKIIEIRHRQDG